MGMWQIRAVLSVLVFVVVGIGIDLCTYLPQCVTRVLYSVRVESSTTKQSCNHRLQQHSQETRVLTARVSYTADQ